MVRVCTRPGCDRPAVARLSYDPVTCAVWLDDVTERMGRNQEICALHAGRLTVPRGWQLADRRSDEAPMFTTAAEPKQDKASRKRRRRRTPASADAAQTLALFDVLRQELSEVAEVEEAPEPEAPAPPERAEPDAAEPAERTEPVVVPGDEEPLPDALKATSPLLARAFAATGHQRSVLTQLASTDAGAESDP